LSSSLYKRARKHTGSHFPVLHPHTEELNQPTRLHMLL